MNIFNKRFIPVTLVLSLLTVLLSHSMTYAHSSERCEQLDIFFQPLGQLLKDNTPTRPMERLCRKVYQAQIKLKKGKTPKAINRLNRVIIITNNHTPEHISEDAAILVTGEAQRLIVILEDNIGLPKDPGEAGKATLEGIDSDNDGVRDDIQRYIALKFTDSAKFKALMTQHAKTMQSAILVADDKALSIEVAHEGSKDFACGRYIKWVVEPENRPYRRRVVSEQDAYILNTMERSRAYIKYNSHLGGQIFKGLEPSRIDKTPLKKYCDFDPDVLPN